MNTSSQPLEQVTERESTAAEQDLRTLDIPSRPYQLGDRLPAQLDPAWMQWVFSIGHTKFYALAKRGVFDRFEFLPRTGRRTWSAALVEEHMRSAGRSAFAFGRKRSA